jgi:hypothetical protein
VTSVVGWADTTAGHDCHIPRMWKCGWLRATVHVPAKSVCLLVTHVVTVKEYLAGQLGHVSVYKCSELGF